MATLTAAQSDALRRLGEAHSSDVHYQTRRSWARGSSLNWYHPRHRPGSRYIDVRTARVLIRLGLAEITTGGGLVRTEAGTTLARAQGAGRRTERSLP